MSITNASCPNKFCEFCDSAEDVYAFYTQYETDDNKGRIPGLIDESN